MRAEVGFPGLEKSRITPKPSASASTPHPAVETAWLLTSGGCCGRSVPIRLRGCVDCG